ncbi:hypothetical protein ACWCP6_28575 [Streptomyces sp. NPDC002004]
MDFTIMRSITTTRQRLIAVTIAVGLAVGLAGCGHNDDKKHASPTSKAAPTCTHAVQRCPFVPVQVSFQLPQFAAGTITIAE